jgi:hypothetical protein
MYMRNPCQYAYVVLHDFLEMFEFKPRAAVARRHATNLATQLLNPSHPYTLLSHRYLDL